MLTRDNVFYRICFDSLLEGICIADTSGRILLTNEALDSMFGYSRGSLVGMEIQKLVPIDKRRMHQKLFNSFVADPKPFTKGKGREFMALHAEGHLFDVEIGLNFFHYKEERYIKALISNIQSRKEREWQIRRQNRDLEKEVERQTRQLQYTVLELEQSNLQLREEVLERMLAEKRAMKSLEKEKELNMMQTKFLSLASHEFKTPLSGILTSAGLIDKYNARAPNKKISNHVSTIKKLVYQLNAILDDFLYLENIESDNFGYQLKEFNPVSLIKKIVKDSGALLKQGQEIVTEFPERNQNVIQDKKVLDMIIRNLLYNAIKYSANTSKIFLKLSIGEEMKLTVSDQGIGIPENALPHVFDRFYRAKNALAVQGTGIGLNIVKRHLDRLKGVITIESALNKGTTVRIGLPLEREVPNGNRKKFVDQT